MEQIIYFTNRLYLKPVCLNDAAFIYKLVNTESWIQHIGDRKVDNLEKAKEYIKKKMQPQFERLGFGNYVIYLKETNVKVGTCGIYDREGLEGVDLGYALYSTFEKNGYAFEAASKMLDLAFREFNLSKVSGITTKENLASQRILKKLNLKESGTVQLENDPELLVLYELEREEYLANIEETE